MVAPIHPKAMPVILTTAEECVMNGFVRLGMKLRRGNGRCRMM